jgi:membrane associated rhomboid family serine protease
MRRSYSPYGSSMSFGPGPLSPALIAIIGANVLLFLAQLFTDQYAWGLTWTLGLRPADVVDSFRVWELGTYMFLHAGIFHILFNMLALWMFGTELERIWGTRYFLKFYFVTGIGAAVLTVLFALLPFGFTRQLEHATIIGASGAIYGLLLAYALYFPDRPIYMYFVFPIPAKYFVMIMGALAFYSSISERSGIANATHLGGLLVAYFFLKSGRMHPLSELKYRYLKWKINRMRSRFDVYNGGRANDWDRRVH